MTLTPTTILLLAIAALCIGLSKAGFSGVSLISVSILAETFGGKESLGLALPLLILADIIVYPAFRKYGSWAQVWPIFIPALVGLALGFWLLNDLPNEIMQPVIGIIILCMALLQLLRTFYRDKIEQIAHTKGFAYSAATSGGVATVLANAAGPIYQLYFLSISLPKMELIGICARFFLVINLIKLPFSANLNLINSETILINLCLAPVLAIGIFTGKKVLTKVPQKMFEQIVLITAIIAGCKLTFF